MVPPRSNTRPSPLLLQVAPVQEKWAALDYNFDDMNVFMHTPHGEVHQSGPRGTMAIVRPSTPTIAYCDYDDMNFYRFPCHTGLKREVPEVRPHRGPRHALPTDPRSRHARAHPPHVLQAARPVRNLEPRLDGLLVHRLPAAHAP